MFKKNTSKLVKWILQHHFKLRVQFHDFENNPDRNMPGYNIAQVEIGNKRYKAKLKFIGEILDPRHWLSQTDLIGLNTRLQNVDNITTPIKFSSYNQFFNVIFKPH